MGLSAWTYAHIAADVAFIDDRSCAISMEAVYNNL
jgi:hypothetical protein